MKFICLVAAATITTVSFAQTVYIPSGTGGIGSSTTANVGIGTNAPVDQLEIVNGNRKIMFNTPISGLSPGGILTLSRPSDGAKVLWLGATATTSNDAVVYGQGNLTELRFVSAGANSAGFGFYSNTDVTTAFASTRPTPIMKLDGTGNLGIGVAAPTSKLHVNGAGNTSIDFRVNGRMITGDANNNGGVYMKSDLSMFVGMQGAANLALFNGGATRMIVDPIGNIAIGTTSAPTARLQVQGTGGTTADLRVNGRIQTGDANNNGGIFFNTAQTMYVGTNAGTNLQLFNGGATRMQIDASGNVGIGTGPVAANRVSIVGTGGTTSDLAVSGRIQTGDATSNGGVLVNTAGTMMFGANGATQMGLFYGGWRLVTTNSGNIGIGNTAPTNRLHVTGGGGTTIDFKVNGRMVTGDAGNTGGMYVDGAMTQFFGQYNATTMGLYNGGGWRMLVDATGNIGIGAAPDSKLTVKGIIHTQEVKVDLAGAVAPDYVFNDDYKLPSLETVKAYIKKNHHLPEVPSAKEMESNGMMVGEMNLLLLKKIEEMTLYMIEMKEQNETLRQELDEIKKLVKK